MAAGRPPKYEKKYCQQLIEYMSQGYSLEAFAGEIGVCRDTIYEWLKHYEEFSYAMGVGRSKSRAFWETEGLKGLWNSWDNSGGRSFNVQNWAMNMRNRFGWDKEDHEEGPPSEKAKGKFTFTKKKLDRDEDES